MNSTNSHQWYLTLCIVMGVFTLIVGNVVAYQSRYGVLASNPIRVRNPVLRFFWDQIVCSLRMPRTTVAFVGGSFMLWVVLLPLLLVFPSLFDLRKALAFERDMNMREQFKEETGMDFKFFTSADSTYHDDWLKRTVNDDLRIARAAQELSEFGSKIGSYFALVASLVLSAVALGPKKARAGEGPEDGAVTDTVEGADNAPMSPPELHGAIMVTGSYDAEGYDLGLAFANIVTTGNVSPDVSWFLLANLATPVSEGRDPILMAYVDWQATEAISLQFGRVFSPLGFSNQPSPLQKIELTYPETGITAPMTDHGVLANVAMSHHWSACIGLVSGEGPVLDWEGGPDALGKLEYTANRSLVGLSAQTGTNAEGPRHAATVYGSVQGERAELQTEFTFAAQGSQSANPTTSASWWALAALQPHRNVTTYARYEAITQRGEVPASHSVVVGANVRPEVGLSLRAAVSVPLSAPNETSFHQAVQVAF